MIKPLLISDKRKWLYCFLVPNDCVDDIQKTISIHQTTAQAGEQVRAVRILHINDTQTILKQTINIQMA